MAYHIGRRRTRQLPQPERSTALLEPTVHTPSELNVPSFGPVHNFDRITFDLME